MKIAGIIAEYNPFHTGHAYQIAQTRQKGGADHIICVISGNFTQRGEPAAYDKWTRAKAALLGGADLVLELPFLYATQSAEGFANGGVAILDALSCIDFLSFGSECADVSAMEQAASLLLYESADFGATLKAQLSLGASYPAARAAALRRCLPLHDKTLFSSPNNILGIEYCKALLRQNSKIKPFTIRREGNEYASLALAPRFSSASAIRRAILSAKETDYQKHLPESSLPLYEAASAVSPESLLPFLLFALRRMDQKELGSIVDVSEGLDYKIMDCAKEARDYFGLIESIKSKRYTYTRIQRILLYCLFGVTKELMASARKEPLYARVLGVKKESVHLLSLLSETSSIPLVTKACEFPEGSLFRFDLLASDIYGLLTQKIAPAGRDFTQRFTAI